MSERWCTCVCAPHFFFMSACLMSKYHDLSNTKQFNSDTLIPLLFVFCVCLFLCENRQQPTWILVWKLRKMVCMHVCSAFFFFVSLLQSSLDENVYWLENNKLLQANMVVCLCLLFFFVINHICARIDNNRREYCEEKVAKDGVHACVLRIFFFFELHNCAS